MSKNTIIVQTKYISINNVFYFVHIICNNILKVYSLRLTGGFSSWACGCVVSLPTSKKVLLGIRHSISLFCRKPKIMCFCKFDLHLDRM
jgi:hypothetical protein